MKNNYNKSEGTNIKPTPILPPAKKGRPVKTVPDHNPKQVKTALDCITAEMRRLELCDNQSRESDQCFGCPAIHNLSYTRNALSKAAGALRSVVNEDEARGR